MRRKKTLIAALAVLVLAIPSALRAQDPGRPSVRVKVTAEQANLRERPDLGSAIVQQIPQGTVLAADSKEGEWYLVRYTLEDGGVIAGYIHESLVLVTAQEPGPPAREALEPETVAPPEPRPKPMAPAPARAPSPAGPPRRPFELSVSIFGGRVDPKDLNDGASGLADFHAAFLGVDPAGSVDPLRLAIGIGLELTYRLSPEISLGLGIDHFRGGQKSTITYAGELSTETLAIEPAFQALPLKFTVRFYPARGFYLKGALGAYHVKAGYLYRYENGSSWLQNKGSAAGWTFGAEAAFGGDWQIGRNLGFYTEAGFRLARWSGLTGRNAYRSSEGEALTEKGTLYSWKQTLETASYPLLYVRAVRPGGADVSGVGAAAVNLNGTFLRAGLRLRF